MGTAIINAAIFLSVLVVCVAEENLQKWSVRTKMDIQLNLTCEDSFNITHVSSTDWLVWKKKDHAGPLGMGNDNYTLSNDRRTLSFHVTDETNGIYFCEVYDMKSTRDRSDDELRGIIIKGLNIGGHEYDDFLDEYKRNLIVGAIAAGSTFFFVVSLGLLSNFRYLTEEQLEKRRQRKEERLQRQRDAAYNSAYDNRGIAMEEMPVKDDIITYTGSDQYHNGKTPF